MPRLKSKKPKGRLLKRVRKQQVRTITILPSLITVLNGVCGFTAIVFASRGAEPSPEGLSYFALAGYMVLLGMVADMLDGRLARMSQNTSSFGGQLDSLCDLISFGIAPAFLMLKIVEGQLSLTSPFSGDVFRRFIWLAAFAYLSCCVIRLARFNVENEENEAAHMSFIGLPSPAAAGVVVSLVIFHQSQAPNFDTLLYLLPFVTLGAAILMVSRLRYPHVLNLYLQGKKPFGYLIRVLFLLGVIYCSSLPAAMVLIFGAFGCSSLVKWSYRRAVHLRRQASDGAAVDAAGPTPSEHSA
jgi:CDP-diacylglycerol--serine O-phosphatidyltransferase